MLVICKNCEQSFERAPSTGKNGQPRLHCSVECCEAYRVGRMKFRYRHEPAFREAVKADNLRRYHASKGR